MRLVNPYHLLRHLLGDLGHSKRRYERYMTLYLAKEKFKEAALCSPLLRELRDSDDAVHHIIVEHYDAILRQIDMIEHIEQLIAADGELRVVPHDKKEVA